MVPLSEALADDFRIACKFFNALNQGVQTVDTRELLTANKEVWQEAQAYLDARPF
jgi:hypothetical protein